MSRKVLVTVPFTDEQKKQLSAAGKEYGDSFIFSEDESVIDREVEDADGIIGNVSPEKLRRAGKLTWMQLNSAGADVYAKEGVVPDQAVLTCATGSYGTALSEYMVCMLLVMMKRIPQYLENQKNGIWRDEGPVTTPAGKRILVVGTGDIGMSFARRIKAFELPDHPITLAGVRRRTGSCPEPLDEIHSVDELPEQVAKADIIAVSMPGSKETYHLFDRELLLKCRRGAYLINIGRGTVLDNEALKDPEISGRFSGIYIDVCEQEPLPDNDPLFRVPNLYITPHITGTYHLDITVQNIADTAEHNYRAWHGECGFKSVVNKKTGYAY